MIGDGYVPKHSLHDKHEREEYISHLVRRQQERTLRKIIQITVEEQSGINDPAKFYMVRMGSGVYVPYKSVPGAEDTDE